MALPCRNAAHGPAFHPWPTAPESPTILPCEQFCHWCAEPELRKKQTTFEPMLPDTLQNILSFQ
jgi:hypothetical protein